MAFGALKGSLTGSNASISTSLAAAGSVAVNVGDLVFAVLFEQTTSTMTGVGDNLHGASTYTLFAAVDAGTTTARAAWKRVTTAGTITAVTAVTNGGTSDGVIDAIVIEGPFDASPFDVHPTDISNDTTTPYLSPASGALAKAPSVVVSWFASTGNATMTVAGPFTKDTEHAISTTGSIRLARQVIQTSTASVAAASWTGTAPTDDVLGIASFKSADLSFSGWVQSNVKARINLRPLAMVAASGLTLVPMPPFEYCAFQNDAFQNDAFQLCAPNIGWFQPFQTVAPRNAQPLAFDQGQPYFSPPDTTVANTVTPDNWLIRWDRPPRLMLNLPGGSPFIPKEATRENTTNTVWPLTLGEIARPQPRPAQQGYHLFVPARATIDNTTGLLWPLTQGEVARPIGRAAPQGYHLFIPDEATQRNTTNRVWPLVFGEKARPIPQAAPQGQHLFVPKEATLDNTIVASWPLTLGEKARPIELPAPQGQHLFVPEEATIENTTNKLWPLTQGELARPITRAAPQGWYAFGYPYLGVDNSTTTLEWQQPLSRAVPIPRVAPVGGSPFIPKEATRDNTTNLVWPLAQGEIARPIQRVAQQGAWAFGREIVSTDNNITGMGWYQPFYPAAPKRPFARTQPVFVTINFDNNIAGMAWHQPFPLVTKLGWPKPNYLRGGAPFVPKEATLENTSTVASWLIRWPEKVPRLRPNRGQEYKPFVPKEATIDNTIRGMAWHMPLSRAAKHAQVCLTQPFYARETPTVVDIPVRRVFSDVYYY